MKNLRVFFVALAGFGLFMPAAQAQVSTTDAQVLSTVTITQLLALTVTPADALVYAAETDYQNGVSSTTPGIGTATATGTFSVSVQANAADFTDGTNSFPVSSVSVTPSNPGIHDLGTLSGSVALSSVTAQPIISGAAPGVLVPFELDYSTQGNDANITGLPTGVYTATLTYTLSLD